MISAAARAKARTEIQKGLTQLQVETAETWGARALEAFEGYRRTSNQRWLLDGEEYMHEAVEHAALAALGGRSDVLNIIVELAQARDRALSRR